MINLQDFIVASGSTYLSTNVNGELVILNLMDETYYGLVGVGARVWELIQQSRTFAELVEQISRDYDVEPNRCEIDVRTLLVNLASKSLVEVRPAPAP